MNMRVRGDRTRICTAGRSRLAAVLAPLALVLAVAIARPVAAAEDETVLLPPMLIEERLAPLNWRYVSIPGFEVLSVCSDEVTSVFVRRVQRLERMLEVILPERFQFQTSVPEIQILFDENLQRARSQEVVREMLRRDGSPELTTAPPAASPFIVLTPVERPVRIRFLPNLRVWDVDATAVFAATPDSRVGAMHDFTFVPERIDYLLLRRVPALPDWFVVGMGELYRQTNLGLDRIDFRPYRWISDEQTEYLQRDPEFPRSLMPIAEMLARRRPEPGTPRDEATQRWRAQCALFVRWAIAEDEGARREGLWRLVERSHAEPVTDTLFRECLGLGFSDARDALSDYLPVAVRRGIRLQPAGIAPVPDFKPRRASDLEIARLRGDWERMLIAYVREHHATVVDKYVNQARETLQRAYRQGVRDPELLALIGLTECDAQNPSDARAYLEPAAQAGIRRPRVYLELAKLRFEEWRAAHPDGRLDRLAVDALVTLLREGSECSPPLLELYILAMRIWEQGEHRPGVDDLRWLNDGLAQFPRFTRLMQYGVQLNIRHGNLKGAIELARLGALHATDAKDRENLERVAAQLASARGGGSH